MAVGLAMAQRMNQQSGGILALKRRPPWARLWRQPRRVLWIFLSPGDAAKLLGVTEADVLQTLEAGN